VQQWPFARSVAIVSDIHELVRESVLEAVSQVDLILHAGDVYDLTGPERTRGLPIRRCRINPRFDRLTQSSILLN
jgi:hypothetical protein